LLQAVPDSGRDEGIWNREHQWRLVRWAAEQVKDEFRPDTWKAFAKTALEHQDPIRVAAELGVSTGAVYIAKSRVLARVKSVIKELEE
jgi:RNA polymerase sigma-70 factor (ECF subfamily)